MANEISKGIDRIGIVGGVVCVIQILPAVGSIFSTESALKKIFDQNGFRR